jgi:hypothetical protein
MRRELTESALYVLIAAILAVNPVMSPALAGVISTDQAFALEAREARIDDIHRLLAEDNVRNTLVRYGVNPEMANERVAALTDAELIKIETRLGELPAGGTGLVEVVGIVAIVLIILELLDVTDVFKSI